jgi:cytosine/adenosine deaminase-related metal-dependent hydrolase
MTTLHFAAACLPDGWAQNVRVTIADGVIRTVTADAPAAHLLDRWIFAAARPGIDAVWVRGIPCVADARHIAGDTIAARFRATPQRRLAA